MTSLRLRIEPPQGQAFRHECLGSAVVVGRSRKADVVVLDQFMSRLHARLSLEGDVWYVEDLGARNTTLVNGRPLQERTRVVPGDVLKVAETLIYVEGPEGEPDQEITGSMVLRPALDSQSDHLRLLNEVHRVLAGSISVEQLLELILDRAFRILKPEEGVIFLKRPDGEFHPAASRRAPEIEGDFLFSRRLLHEVADKGLAALVADAIADERFSNAQSIIGSGVRSIVAAPLMDSEGCSGVIALNSRAQVKRFSELDLELLVSLASAAALRIRNIALAEEAGRRRLLEKELALAQDIQMAMLPRRLPQHAEFELAAKLRSAKSVGGDLYDFLLDGDSLWFLVADVSGKGVAAALFMAVTKTLFRAIVQAEPSLPRVLSRMNRELHRDNERAMFVTAFLGHLSLSTGAVDYANAGHNPPYLLGGEGRVSTVEGAHGVPLGVVDEYEYPAARLELEPGDGLYLYTDGVTEGLNARGEAFTEERLEAYLGKATQAGADELVRGSLGALEEFVGAAEPSDDVTVMAIRYLSRAEPR